MVHLGIYLCIVFNNWKKKKENVKNIRGLCFVPMKCFKNFFYESVALLALLWRNAKCKCKFANKHGAHRLMSIVFRGFTLRFAFRQSKATDPIFLKCKNLPITCFFVYQKYRSDFLTWYLITSHCSEIRRLRSMNCPRKVH